MTEEKGLNMGSVEDYQKPSAIEDCESTLADFDDKTFVINDAIPYTFDYDGKTIEGMKVSIDGKLYYTSRSVIVKQLTDMSKGFTKGIAFKVRMVKPKGKKYFVLEDA